MRTRFLLAVGLGALLVAGASVSVPAELARASGRMPRKAAERLPASFEENQGQFGPGVAFAVRGHGYRALVGPTQTTFALGGGCRAGRTLRGEAAAAPGACELRRRSALRLSLLGASPAAPATGVDQLPGIANYFLGNDPALWHTDVPTYAAARFSGVYPRTDLTFRGNGTGLEYDFVLAPGADPKAIRMGIAGARDVRIDRRGALVLRSAAGSIVQQPPRAFQQSDSGRRRIPARFVRLGHNRVGFGLGAYDRSRPLVIDPVVTFSTYLGGAGDDFGRGIAVDSSGSAYVVGTTASVNFPTQGPVLAANAGGSQDAFVAKINASRQLVYSTYLGGNTDEFAGGIAVDSSGNAYVTGSTTSPDFPRHLPFQNALAGGGDAFVSKLNPTGSALVYSTYLGGSDFDFGRAIAVGSDGSAFVTGSTDSSDFPLSFPVQSANAGGTDVFVTKLNPAGSALPYSTYLGGSHDEAAGGIALGADGSAFVTGATDSTDFPLSFPVQGAAGGSDAFVAKLNPAGRALVYSTHLGGSSDDFGRAIAVDANGRALVTGSTDSTNFPLQLPLQSTAGGNGDAFVTVLSPAGSSVAYSTYLGGSQYDIGTGIAVDNAGRLFVAGGTDSTDFPLHLPVQAAAAGGGDAFVTSLPVAAFGVVYSTYLGGADFDLARGVAADAAGTAYITGGTASVDFPLSFPIQNANGGGNDAFVTRVALNAPTSLGASPTTVPPGGTTTVSWSGIPSPTPRDWIGLFSSSGAANTAFLTWRYTTGTAAGNVPFTVPFGTPAGTTYEFRLFANNGYTRLATSAPFTVPPPDLSASPSTVNAGAATTVTWSAIPKPTSTDWVGLFSSPGAADTAFLTWRYTDGNGTGSGPLTIPAGTPTGTNYQLRLFSNNGYTRLAVSAPITVQ